MQSIFTGELVIGVVVRVAFGVVYVHEAEVAPAHCRNELHAALRNIERRKVGPAVVRVGFFVAQEV
eukprot:2191344-Rhodomonas_salina.3